MCFKLKGPDQRGGGCGLGAWVGGGEGVDGFKKRKDLGRRSVE